MKDAQLRSPLVMDDRWFAPLGTGLAVALCVAMHIGTISGVHRRLLKALLADTGYRLFDWGAVSDSVGPAIFEVPLDASAAWMPRSSSTTIRTQAPVRIRHSSISARAFAVVRAG